MNNVINSFKFQNTLSPDIWENAATSDFKQIRLKSDVRAHLLEVAQTFIDSINVEPIDLHDILLVGSSCNYNWSKYSDLDVHILIDKSALGSNLELVDEFLNAKRANFGNNHEITVKNFDVELYVQDINEKLDSKGVYSILYNKWIAEPSKSAKDIDKPNILSKVKVFFKEFDKIKKTSDAKEKIAKIDVLKEKIKKYRQAGLDKSGEFGVENMVFKYLRRVGFIEDLSDLKYKTLDKKLSLENA